MLPRPILDDLLLRVGAGFLTVFVVVSVAVASLGEDFLVVVVAFFPVLALAGAGVLDHPHLT